MTDEENVDHALNLIEGVNSMADTMDAMKCALEARGWSTAMSEQVGATLGASLFAMMATGAVRPQEPPRGRKQ
jgi:hypothetical protein